MADKVEARVFETREAVVPMKWATLDDFRRLVEATTDFPGKSVVRLLGLTTDPERPRERYLSGSGQVAVRHFEPSVVIPDKGQG